MLRLRRPFLRVRLSVYKSRCSASDFREVCGLLLLLGGFWPFVLCFGLFPVGMLRLRSSVSHSRSVWRSPLFHFAFGSLNFRLGRALGVSLGLCGIRWIGVSVSRPCAAHVGFSVSTLHGLCAFSSARVVGIFWPWLGLVRLCCAGSGRHVAFPISA